MRALIITFLYRKVSVDRNTATDFSRRRAGIRSRNHRNTDIVTVVLATRYDVDFRKAHDAFGKLSVVCNHVAAPLKVAAVDNDLDEV
jgi:hypothetical protein